jgi:ankyrin repeat protein
LSINWKNKFSRGWTAFYCACYRGHVDIVQVLMAHPDIDINQKGHIGRTPFFMACNNGHSSIVRMFLNDSRLITINDRNDFGYTPLSEAVCCGKLEVIKWMISSGRELDLGEGKLRSDALQLARNENNTEINTEIVSLLERFKKDQVKTRYEIRKELGLHNDLAAELFSLSVLQLHGKLQIKTN